MGVQLIILESSAETKVKNGQRKKIGWGGQLRRGEEWKNCRFPVPTLPGFCSLTIFCTAPKLTECPGHAIKLGSEKHGYTGRRLNNGKEVAHVVIGGQRIVQKNLFKIVLYTCKFLINRVV